MSRNTRIYQELLQLSTAALANNDQPPVFACAKEENLDHIVAVITGSSETPYHFGFYQFDLHFSETYPQLPPVVKLTTTDCGRVRFNPNLYADGKVCLSILGTWNGASSEKWRSEFTIEYVLHAIQALVMNSKPFHNEPGFEEVNKQQYEDDELQPVTPTFTPLNEHQPQFEELGDDQENRRFCMKQVQAYSDKILHENLRVAVCSAMENALSGSGEQFSGLIKREFLLRFETYVSISKKYSEALDGRPFLIMPFESPGNIADGQFDFQKITCRLADLRRRLDEETELWKQQGQKSTAEGSSSAQELIQQYETITDAGLEDASGGPISTDNVFVWNLHFLGPHGSIYEGASFSLELVFPPPSASGDFPRVRFLTPMFHPNVSPSGYPWFGVSLTHALTALDIVKVIQTLLATEPRGSSATWLNESAAQLCFSKEESQRKQWRSQAIAAFQPPQQQQQHVHKSQVKGASLAFPMSELPFHEDTASSLLLRSC